jgi:hypothetical protein
MRAVIGLHYRRRERGKGRNAIQRPAERDQVASSLADVQRITLRRTGHFSSLERPHDVERILIEAVPSDSRGTIHHSVGRTEQSVVG